VIQPYSSECNTLLLHMHVFLSTFEDAHLLKTQGGQLLHSSSVVKTCTQKYHSSKAVSLLTAKTHTFLIFHTNLIPEFVRQFVCHSHTVAPIVAHDLLPKPSLAPLPSSLQVHLIGVTPSLTPPTYEHPCAWTHTCA
jgi:hypothetical protein